MRVLQVNARDTLDRNADYIKGYVNKLEILLLKIKDGQVTPTEFKLFQGLLKEYECGMINSKSKIKSKDVKKVEKIGKKGIVSAAFESTL